MNNELSKLPEIKSLTDIIRHSKQLPTLRNSDEKEVNSAILSLLIEVFTFYNETLNDVQLKLTLPTVKEALQGLTIPDIHIFKKHCLQGEYPLKFRLIPNVLIEWIKQYKFDRGEAFASMSYLSHVETKKETEYSEKTVELLKGLEKKVSEKLGEKHIISSIAPTENKYQKQAKELQKWIEKEFEGVSETAINPMPNKDIKFFDNSKGRFKPTIEQIKAGEIIPEYLFRDEYVKLRFEEIHKNLSDKWEDGFCDPELTKTEYIYKEIEMLIK